jgi:hypothetical protein
MANLGRIAPRECEGVFRRHCEERRDEAIHACLRSGTECFASLAMTPLENAREKVNACFDVFARSDSDEAIHSCLRGGTDCFAGARNDGFVLAV